MKRRHSRVEIAMVKESIGRSHTISLLVMISRKKRAKPFV